MIVIRRHVINCCAWVLAHFGLIIVLSVHKLATLLIQHFPETQMRRPSDSILKKLPVDAKLAIHLLYDLAVPAVRDINTQIKLQADRQHERDLLVLAMMAQVPDDAKADFLLGLQANDYDGCAKVIEAIESLYVGLIDSCTNGYVRGVEAETARIQAIRD